MSNIFHPILDTYAKGKIDSVHFNMDIDTISVAITALDELSPVEIIFEDVKSFYYIDHDLKTDLVINHESLDVIAYDLYGFGEFSAAGSYTADEHFVSIPNFAVNLNDSSLYIDAPKIRINNTAYKVK